MANVQIIGRKGSKARRDICKNTDVKIYKPKTSDADAIINYGLAGQKLDHFFRKNPSAKNIPMINKYVGRSKLGAIIDAEKEGVAVPESRLSLPITSKVSNWIEKKQHSSQGKGIKAATHRKKIIGKYYQKMINNRVYELRVHAFVWIPKEEWAVHKRFGPEDQIAWNFHQGGRFQSVKNPNGYRVFREAKDLAEKILSIRKMVFGAVDFIVDAGYNIYFIEINSSPGFTTLSEGIYLGAMKRLTDMTSRQIREYTK